MTDTPDKNGWSIYQLLVLDRLDKLERTHRHLDSKLTQILVDIATLKVKSGLWGAAASGVVVGLALLAKFVLNL